MCRFVAYFGQKPLLIDSLIRAPVNSLIKQSKEALLASHCVNADGIGIGWYNKILSREPGVFRSIQPAWNDRNLSHLISKTSSDCFIGHVRACTVGEVGFFNCHPFYNNDVLFAHNGTVNNFRHFVRKIIDELDNEGFNLISGTTDSEVVFSLISTYLRQRYTAMTLENLYQAQLSALNLVTSIQKDYRDHPDNFTRYNTILTDGESLIATRYITHPGQDNLSIYYASGKETSIHLQNGERQSLDRGIVISAEPLDSEDYWQELPENHALCIDKHLRLTIKSIQ